MKPIREVLSSKESELQRLQHDIDILRQAIHLLEDESDVAGTGVTVHAGASRSNQLDSPRTSPSSAIPDNSPGRKDTDLRPFP